MTLSLIDVGTTANDGTGDPLRTAFQTVNTALTAVNNAIVVGTDTTTFKDDSGSTGVTVLADGKVGIGGVGSPTYPLHVRVDQASSTYALVQNADAAGAALFQATANTYYVQNSVTAAGITTVASNAIDMRIGLTVTGTVYLRTANANRIILGSTGDVTFNNAGATAGMTWDASANSNAGGLGIRTATPTGALDVNDDTIRVRTAKTPASAAATGNAGDICWDASYIYVCTATNTWKRSAIATW